jgi:hypothetical protein
MSKTKAWTTFNINNYVLVQLTDHGREIIRENFANLKKSFPKLNGPNLPNEDEGSWSRWQLWDLMSTFGPHIGLGLENPFATVIQIEGNME